MHRSSFLGKQGIVGATLSGLLGGLFGLHPSLPQIGSDQQKQHQAGSSYREEGREEKQNEVCGLLGDLTNCILAPGI